MLFSDHPKPLTLPRIVCGLTSILFRCTSTGTSFNSDVTELPYLGPHQSTPGRYALNVARFIEHTDGRREANDIESVPCKLLGLLARDTSVVELVEDRRDFVSDIAEAHMRGSVRSDQRFQSLARRMTRCRRRKCRRVIDSAGSVHHGVPGVASWLHPQGPQFYAG